MEVAPHSKESDKDTCDRLLSPRRETDKHEEGMKKILEIAGFILVVGVIFCSVVWGGVLGVTYGIDRPRCLAQYSNYQPQWGFWSKCRIIYNGVLTPTDMVKNINLQ